MNISRHHGKIKKVQKYCSYEYPLTKQICNHEFFGVPIRKYCNFHTNEKNRDKNKNKNKPDKTLNISLIHSFRNSTTIELPCHVPKCPNTYRFNTIHKREYPYPKYCSDHQTKYQRLRFMKETKQDSKLLETIVSY